jgi:cellulose synthase/poly-beta-1,6-N-acetylglucosamine synthase-like glycosyltransferase
MVPGTVAILHRGSVSTALLPWVRTLGSDVQLVTLGGNQIARQRNLAVQMVTGDWLLFVDADSVPPPDTLPRLLGHDVDLVGGVILERYPPFAVCAVRSADPLHPARFRLPELPREGLLEAAAVGTGCLLIRRSVLETIEAPWFRCGQVIPDLLLEDTEFCLRAHAAGVTVHLDCSLRVGHEIGGGYVVWPGRDGRMWLQCPGPTNTWLPVDLSSEEVSVPSGGSDRDR